MLFRSVNVALQSCSISGSHQRVTTLCWAGFTYFSISPFLSIRCYTLIFNRSCRGGLDEDVLELRAGRFDLLLLLSTCEDEVWTTLEAVSKRFACAVPPPVDAPLRQVLLPTTPTMASPFVFQSGPRDRLVISSMMVSRSTHSARPRLSLLLRSSICSRYLYAASGLYLNGLGLSAPSAITLNSC